MKTLKILKSLGIILVVAILGTTAYMTGNLINKIKGESDRRQAYYELPVDSEELTVALNPNYQNPLERYGSRVAGESTSLAEESVGGNIGSALTSVSTTEIDLDDLYELINKTREENDLDPLKANEQLEESSLSAINDMVSNNYYDHKEYDKIIKESGYNAEIAGEMLAVNLADNESILEAWMTGENIKNTLLNKQFNEMGVSYRCQISIENYDNTCLIALHLAKPQDT